MIFSKNKILFFCCWLVVLFFLLFFLAPLRLWNSDEGLLLAGAWDLLHGKDIYVNFFEFTPPGVFYLVFWAWKLFGASFLAAKILSIIALFLSAVGVYKIASLLDEQSDAKSYRAFVAALIIILSSLGSFIMTYHVSCPKIVCTLLP